MGTPDFAVPCLKALVENGYEVAAVVTQPDKPVGRKGSVLMPPDVKKAALELGIQKILQPEKVRTPEFKAELDALAPDMIVTAAYGRIIPQAVLDIPPMGCINVHGSLLPKYRGAAPIQWAIINGDSVTGITTMYMDAGMDTGDILLKKEMPITEDMTYSELYDGLKELGAAALIDTLKGLEAGTIIRIPQNHEEASKVPMMTREMGEIDWKKPAQEIHNLVRGTNPWPGAYTKYKDERLKIWKTKPVGPGEACMPGTACHNEGNGPAEDIPGKICSISKNSMIVATGDGYLKVLELQFDCCRRMGIYECGHNMDEGEILG
jgi:methionyl-tRNA formyltransferase